MFSKTKCLRQNVQNISGLVFQHWKSVDFLLAQNLNGPVQAFSRINIGKRLDIAVLNNNELKKINYQKRYLFENFSPRTNLVLLQLLNALAYLAFCVVPKKVEY